MDDTASRRTDDELLFMMDETAEWTVNGRAGVALCLVHSLRGALQAVFDFEGRGHHVFALCSQPGDAIIVFREKIGRITAADGMIDRAMPRKQAA
jgi:hypothetical protein